jgi:5-methylcytosine-specific restriction protein A
MFNSFTQKEIVKMDVPVVCEKPIVMEYKIWRRSGILRTQTIELSDYQCEFDHDHKTFIAESTSRPYMEAHHIIPLQHQEKFGNSLDVYANLISLCPICHRKIHFGLRDERRSMVDELYEKRKERLVNCGLIMGKEEFENLLL